MQIVSVIDYLHNVVKIAHRDLKLENILLDRFNNVKVIDFGLSHIFESDQTLFTTPCGSYLYISPELILTGTSGLPADIWDLGVILYCCATGKMPFCHSNLQILSRQITKHEIVYPRHLSENLIDLLQKMLCRDPTKRITINQIKCHDWFPIDGYKMIKQAFESELEIGFDNEIIQRMEGNGLDWSEIVNAMREGEQNDITVLYKIYQRQKQDAKMNEILRAWESGRKPETVSTILVTRSEGLPRSPVLSMPFRTKGGRGYSKPKVIEESPIGAISQKLRRPGSL
jgi:serine/threonine protein kinase